MKSFLFVLPVEQIEVKMVYSSLPLHCTLMSWFNLDATPEELINESSLVFSQRGLIELVSDTPALFGRNNNIPVHRLATNLPLKNLHDDLQNVLNRMDVEYIEPLYVGNGYNPHITTKGGRSFPPGSRRIINCVYLVEALDKSRLSNKKVTTKISLL